MKIIKILKREEEVDQLSYILWTWPGPILLAFLLFLGTEQGDRFMGKYLMDMSGALLAVAFLVFLLMLIFVIFLSGRRFVMFQQSGYLALLMLLIPGYFIIWVYLAFRKDLYYLKESRENNEKRMHHVVDVRESSMKKYWLIILGVLLLFGAACDKEKEIENYNSYLQTPRYSEAQKRAEIGNLFYETEERIGIHTSFGVFLYDVEEEKMLTAFDLNVEKAFGEGVLSETRLSSDEKGIYLFGFTHEKTIDDYHYYYEIASGSLYKKSGKAEEKDLFPLPDQDRQAFTTTNWTAEDLAYYPVGSLDPIYPLKGVQ